MSSEKANSIMWCVKHHETEFDWGGCLKCQANRNLGHCYDCEKHDGTVVYADSTMAFIHGMSLRICRCCHLKRVEAAYRDVEANFQRLQAEVSLTGCQ